MQYPDVAPLLDWLYSRNGTSFLIIAVAAFALAAVRSTVRRAVWRRRRSSLRRPFTAPVPPRNVTPLRPVAPPRRDPADPVIQMEAVHRSEFRKIRLLNKEEARLLPVIERTLRDIGGGHRVMAQTSLGEVISPVSMGTNDRTAEQAFASINSKRLDFALIDRFGMLALAVEYQGSGHYQGRAFMRDAVKKGALRKAGVPTLEVMPDFDPDSLADQIRRALVTPAPDAPG